MCNYIKKIYIYKEKIYIVLKQKYEQFKRRLIAEQGNEEKVKSQQKTKAKIDKSIRSIM